MSKEVSIDTGPDAPWTFLTSHAQAFLYIATHPGARVREVAEAAAITERRTYSILRDLEEAGYLVRHRRGNRVEFEIDRSVPMRAQLVRDVPVRELLQLFDGRASG